MRNNSLRNRVCNVWHLVWHVCRRGSKNGLGCLVGGRSKVVMGEVGIPLYHFYIPMPKDLCQRIEIYATHDGMAGEGMPQAMKRKRHAFEIEIADNAPEA